MPFIKQINKLLSVVISRPESIPTLTERLRSRFEWGMSIDIQMPDFETRCAILEAKAAASGVELGSRNNRIPGKQYKNKYSRARRRTQSTPRLL